MLSLERNGSKMLAIWMAKAFVLLQGLLLQKKTPECCRKMHLNYEMYLFDLHWQFCLGAPGSLTLTLIKIIL